MKDHYYVTIHCIALCSSKFYEAVEQEHVYYRDLVKCEVIEETEHGLKLRVPEMYGVKNVIAYARPYNNEEEFSLDSHCYESIEEFRKANLRYAKNRLVRQIGFLMDSDHYDYERMPYFEKAVEQFKAAYSEHHNHENRKEN